MSERKYIEGVGWVNVTSGAKKTKKRKPAAKKKKATAKRRKPAAAKKRATAKKRKPAAKKKRATAKKRKPTAKKKAKRKPAAKKKTAAKKKPAAARKPRAPKHVARREDLLVIDSFKSVPTRTRSKTKLSAQPTQRFDLEAPTRRAPAVAKKTKGKPRGHKRGCACPICARGRR